MSALQQTIAMVRHGSRSLLCIPAWQMPILPCPDLNPIPACRSGDRDIFCSDRCLVLITYLHAVSATYSSTAHLHIHLRPQAQTHSRHLGMAIRHARTDE